MDHRELEQIRQGIGSQKSAESDENSKQQQEMKNSVLSQILTPDARERLNRIQIVRPERAQEVEQMLLRLAQSGQLRAKINEDQLVDLLGRLNQEKESKVTFHRKYDSGDEDEIIPTNTNNQCDDEDDDDFFD